MKEGKIIDTTVLARKVARTMLNLKATSYKKTGEPYKWSSGMEMRVYNDNRMMLGCYFHRMRVRQGILELIDTYMPKDQDFYILGTSTAGIAPAATIAQLYKKILINHNDQFYVYDAWLPERKTINALKNIEVLNVDAVVSTTPFAIPYGVQYANTLQKGFAYIRKKPKDHGKGLLVEGNLKPGMKIALITCCTIEDDWTEAMSAMGALEEMGYKVSLHNQESIRHSIIPSEELREKNVVVIEDLFSTGESAAYEVFKLREAGAVCDNCFSIFSYEFNVLKKQFSGESMIGNKGVRLETPCRNKSLLSFRTLIREMERIGFYSPAVRNAMANEINGFDEAYKQFLLKKAT
jgi:orotate phosphoribosyltransferase